ncbi:class I SAM-dependent methyltransferase [Thermococcus paralvinellae]|uniref:Class I SAM-dependent methyltransferase n=1 Tax=Thermococcus paralvinellae TaxID=582419 RepID=W0I5B9_9EURY|nr:class I SAM-dependent methyltransferase [Thermococcus paralvinellae]AHF81264.1 Hypothetical protein TES1_1889 [Thermococcus paralvinellae]
MTMLDDILKDIQNMDIPNIEHIIPSIGFYVSAIQMALKYKKNTSSLTVLDIGCSRGYGIYIMNKLCPNCQFVGVDLDERNINIANKVLSGLSNATCVLGDIIDERTREYLHLKYGFFDVITCFEVYEHVPPKNAEILLKNIRFLLKPGGFLFISTPNKRVYDIDAYTVDHINEVYPQEFIRKLELAGFSIIKVFGSYTQNPILIRALERLNLVARIGDRRNELSFAKKLVRYLLVSVLSPSRMYGEIIKRISYRKYLQFKAKKARLSDNYLNSSLILIIARKDAKN